MIDPAHALRAAPVRPDERPTVLVAGATGTLGNEVLRRLAGLHHYREVLVTAREPIAPAFRGVRLLVCPPNPQADTSTPASDHPMRDWPTPAAQVGVVLFEPPRLRHGRERALWTPHPDELPAAARWMRRCGVRSLAVVMPHVAGRLPQAVQRGLATLDEQAVAAIGFEQLLIVRSARKPGEPAVRGSAGQRVADWVLGALRYMVPTSQQPVRADRVAALATGALRRMHLERRGGIHVAAPELVWQASQQPVDQVIDRLLAPTPR